MATTAYRWMFWSERMAVKVRAVGYFNVWCSPTYPHEKYLDVDILYTVCKYC